MSYLKRLLPRLGGYKFNVWVERRQSEFGKIVTRNYVSDNELQGNRRFFSQSRQLRDSSEADPIRAFDSQPSLRTNSFAMSEYLKTLQKVIEEESSIGGLNAALKSHS